MTTATTFADRGPQAVLLLSLGVVSWLGMMGVHELGHVLGAWATGGRVQQVVWHPLVLSRTDVAADRSPGVTVWAGPIVGAVLPAVVYGVAAGLRWGAAPLLGFFAGFCLIANGAYIGIGAFEGVADAGVMLVLGAPRWTLVVFGVVTTAAGFAVWRRESGWFGFGSAPRRVGARSAAAALALAVVAVAVGLLFGNRGAS